MAEPRPSTDEEHAPLLAGGDDDQQEQEQRKILGVYDPSRPLTRLEKVLGAVALLFLIISATFIGLFAGTEHTLKKERSKHGDPVTYTTTATATRTVPPGGEPTGKPSAPVCTSSDCVVVAASIVQSLNTSADPCDDFYEYAVGGWLDANTIPADRGIYGSFHAVADNNKKILTKILDSIDNNNSDKSADASNRRKLKTVYQNCLDIDTLNKAGLEPFSPLAKFVVDKFADFNINPLPKADSLVDAAWWRGAYDESYTIPERLVAAAERNARLRESQRRGELRGSSSAIPASSEAIDFKPEPVDKERRDKITAVLAFLDARSVDTLFNFEIDGDSAGNDSQIQALLFSQGFGGLPAKEYYDEAPVVDLYHSVITGVLKEIAKDQESATKRSLISDLAGDVTQDGWPWPWPGDDDKGGDDDEPDETFEERIDRLAGLVVDFETKLVKAGADPEYISNPHYANNPYKSKDLDSALPFIDLPGYLSTFAPRLYPETITVTYPPYLKSISKLVAKTPDHVLSAYFVTKIALTYASALGPDVALRGHVRRLTEALQGIKKGTEENRQDVCLGWVDALVGFIAGREYVNVAFSPEAKKDGEDIINSIVTAFHDKLPHIDWMDKESATAAQKKAKAIIPKVGYPLYPDTTKPESLAAWYSRLDVKKGNFFDTVVQSSLIDNSRAWLSLGRKRNRDSWLMNPQTVNAYYSPPDGEIVFPAGILQPPFYSIHWPEYLRYAAFGAVAAHELTHAFDNQGAQYDENGLLRDWWTNSTLKAFDERAQCIARQYSKYYMLDAEGNKVYVNGNLTNGEDIADSGLQQAHAAWKALKLNDVGLPGLDFTPDQLFFLGFARIWATLVRPATAIARIRTDPHSPGIWRATGTLRNLPAFHEAFGCKPGTKMNPRKEDQCRLW
ncbi:hypothetical protein Q8F55_001991 [Vanrija albida]|uniref:Endothelin-converting enzyme 1 n=1 Tax=Vanrija albida TaxID=181172 RepID=A0ABR3Q8I2_9TREE